MVSTPTGVEGMHLPPDAVVVAETAADFAARIIELFDDLPRLERMSDIARRTVERDYSQHALQARLREVLGDPRR